MEIRSFVYGRVHIDEMIQIGGYHLLFRLPAAYHWLVAFRTSDQWTK